MGRDKEVDRRDSLERIIGGRTRVMTISGSNLYHAVATGDHFACSLPCPVPRQLNLQLKLYIASQDIMQEQNLASIVPDRGTQLGTR